MTDKESYVRNVRTFKITYNYTPDGGLSTGPHEVEIVASNPIKAENKFRSKYSNCEVTFIQNIL